MKPTSTLPWSPKKVAGSSARASSMAWGSNGCSRRSHRFAPSRSTTTAPTSITPIPAPSSPSTKHSHAITMLIDEPSSVSGIAVDECCVYWLAQDGMVKRVGKDGANDTVLAVHQWPPTPVLQALLVDETRVYWIAGGEVRSSPK